MQQGAHYASPGQSPGEAVPYSQLPPSGLMLTLHHRGLLWFSKHAAYSL